MDANGGAAAVLGNNFFTASKNGFYTTSGDETSGLKNAEDQSIVDKYNAEWVENLFSSNKIEIEFKFYVRWAGGAPDYNLIDKNASFKVLSLGGVSAAELSDKGEFADTIAPEVNATASIELEKGKAYELRISSRSFRRPQPTISTAKSRLPRSFITPRAKSRAAKSLPPPTGTSARPLRTRRATRARS